MTGTVRFDAVRINGGTQSRVELNQVTISEYTEAIRASIELPPVVTFFDGAVFWLADGFHRFHAHRAAGTDDIPSHIYTGTQRDAILYSVGANASHGLRRKNEDKRRAVLTLLNDPEWSAWSDREIARQCAVHHDMVGGLRKSSLAETPVTSDSTERAYTTKHGTTATINTANIGKAKPAGEEVAHTGADKSVPPTAGAPAPATVLETSDEVITLREQLAEVAEHLKSTLADNEMMGRVFDADDQIKAAMTEAVRQKAIAENAERTLATRSGEFIARAVQVTHWMNRAQKAEKALAKLEASK